MSCPWCGAGLGAAESTRVATAPPPSAAVASTPDIGFGDGSKPLPPLPPPPKSLPITALNPTQVFLRTLIVLGACYLLFLLGRRLVEFSACAVPGSPLCQ